MRKIVSLILSASLISSLAYAEDDYEDFNPIEYSYQQPGDGYSPNSGPDFSTYYRQNACQDTAGDCYYNCSRASCLTVGVAIGAAVIITMVAIIVKDGRSAHCH